MSRCKACDKPLNRVAFVPGADFDDELCSHCVSAISESEYTPYIDYQFGSVPENTGTAKPTSD